MYVKKEGAQTERWVRNERESEEKQEEVWGWVQCGSIRGSERDEEGGKKVNCKTSHKRSKIHKVLWTGKHNA